MKKSDFYYNGHYKKVAGEVYAYLNSSTLSLNSEIINSPRAVGGVIESTVASSFEKFLGSWCQDYSSEFARRSMADIAFTDKMGVYSMVDVKTHREEVGFHMPNLTSVERLSRLYESPENVFAILMVKYRILDGKDLNVSEVIFSPIEFLSWDCLTIGALGWGQIQIANSENIIVEDKMSRRDWMLTFCLKMEEFYPKEIAKINGRIEHFERIKNFWEKQKDIWK